MFSSTGFMQINDHHHHHHHNHYYYYSSPSALSGPAKSNIGCWDVWKTWKIRTDMCRVYTLNFTKGEQV